MSTRRPKSGPSLSPGRHFPRTRACRPSRLWSRCWASSSRYLGSRLARVTRKFPHPATEQDNGVLGLFPARRVEKQLMNPTRSTMLALALIATAVSASELASLVDLPVEGTTLVPASQYRGVSSRAARTGSPVDVALSVPGTFEGSQQVILQANQGVESPSTSHVTVIRDGLLDDAVRTERWDIGLARTAAGSWEIREVRKSWRCWRGPATAGFAAQPCI